MFEGLIEVFTGDQKTEGPYRIHTDLLIFKPTC